MEQCDAKSSRAIVMMLKPTDPLYERFHKVYMSSVTTFSIWQPDSYVTAAYGH